jgi:hypothetical protein
MFAAAGLLDALGAACNSLSGALEQQQQQQVSDPGALAAVYLLSFKCLGLWNAWPVNASATDPGAAPGSEQLWSVKLKSHKYAQLLAGAESPAAVLPAVARLTLALLRTAASEGSNSGSSSSSSSSSRSSTAASRHGSSSNSSSSSRSSSVSGMWALSRGLLDCGQRLQELATPSSSSSSSISSSTAGTSAAAGMAAASGPQGISDAADLDAQWTCADFGQSLQPRLPCFNAAVGWLVQQLPLLQLPGRTSSSIAGGGGSSAAAEAAGDSGGGSSSSSSTDLLQQLMSQAEDVQQQIYHCQTALTSSGANLSTHVHQLGPAQAAVASRDTELQQQAGQLGRALVSFGCALCAVLPSKHCCNHTGCTNLARLSEAELVAGKGCVCSR